MTCYERKRDSVGVYAKCVHWAALCHLRPMPPSPDPGYSTPASTLHLLRAFPRSRTAQRRQDGGGRPHLSCEGSKPLLLFIAFKATFPSFQAFPLTKCTRFTHYVDGSDDSHHSSHSRRRASASLSVFCTEGTFSVAPAFSIADLRTAISVLCSLLIASFESAAIACAAA